MEYFFSRVIYSWLLRATKLRECPRAGWLWYTKKLIHLNCTYFERAFGFFLFKNSLVKKCPQKLGPEGTFNLHIYKQQGFGPDASVGEYFSPWMQRPCP